MHNAFTATVKWDGIHAITLTLGAMLLLSCASPGVKEALNRIAVSGEQIANTVEVAAGIKQALEIGITEGAEVLAVRDGYLKSPFKIRLPPEAQAVANRLKPIPGFSSVESIIVERLNRAAEDAAARAAPIFREAIRNMSIRDAIGILMGAEDAATQHLRYTSYDRLYAEFNPVIVTSLDKFNARTYWADAINAYNRLPLEQKANPSLDEYVTHEALKGLFAWIEQKELQIRTDVSARNTELLRRVFARQDKPASSQ